MMNKAEKAMVQELRERLALRLTDAVLPDLPVPEPGGAETRGWLWVFPGAATRCVSRAGVNWRGVGSDWSTTAVQCRASWQQGGVALYSTRALALRAYRCEREVECARQLFRIDEAIAAAEVLDAADAEELWRLEALSPSDRADLREVPGVPRECSTCHHGEGDRPGGSGFCGGCRVHHDRSAWTAKDSGVELYASVPLAVSEGNADD